MKSVSRAVLIQPPFVQLNNPYPAPYYLKSFLEKMEIKTTVLDHSIGLFERIFSRSGLEKVFEDAEAAIKSGKVSNSSISDQNTFEIVERFF